MSGKLTNDKALSAVTHLIQIDKNSDENTFQ